MQTTTTASRLIGARPSHQPVLNIQVYIVDFPFSCYKRNKELIERTIADLKEKMHFVVK